MDKFKKIAMLYGLAGAGVAVWEYSKGYSLDPTTILLWPMRVSQINKAPKNAVASGSSRPALVFT